MLKSNVNNNKKHLIENENKQKNNIDISSVGTIASCHRREIGACFNCSINIQEAKDSHSKNINKFNNRSTINSNSNKINKEISQEITALFEEYTEKINKEIALSKL